MFSQNTSINIVNGHKKIRLIPEPSANPQGALISNEGKNNLMDNGHSDKQTDEKRMDEELISSNVFVEEFESNDYKTCKFLIKYLT